MITSSPGDRLNGAIERTSTTEISTLDQAPADTFTADEILEVIREACIHLDPRNSVAYRSMNASHIREAVRANARLLEAHQEYVRTSRITRRGRRKHADTIYRLLDLVPPPYLVVAMAWSLLPATILDAPEPDPSRRSPLRTAT
jgi:hypothetical protein